MSTFTALHIQSDRTAAIHKMLAAWLKSVHRVKSITTKQGDFPIELYTKAFIMGGKPPTMLAIGSTQPDWVTVHYNSFYDMKDVASKASRDLSCITVVVMAQSVSEAYYLSIHKQGEHLRTLEWVGDQGEWVKQEGQPLPFEQRPLDKNIAEQGAEPFYIFEREAVAEYCSQLGLQVWNEYYGPNWITLSPKKPWWRFNLAFA